MEQIKSHYAWIGPYNGYAVLYWYATAPESKDWVGLYSSQSQGMDDYLTWQWATKGSSYVSEEIIRNGLSIRYYYWSGSPGGYRELMRTNDLNLESAVNAQEERTLHPGCWVTCSANGYATLNWTSAHVSDPHDWVALYSDIFQPNENYIRSAWQWVTSGTSYTTSQAFQPGLHARYIREQDGKYVALRRSKPIATGYLDIENIYASSSSTGRRPLANNGWILSIMADQLAKAVKGEPSLFALGMWPLSGDNLLYKNLSYEEVKVIRDELSPSQYYDVLWVYYETYRMAIQIADDSERNAKRHAFWQISLVRKFGKIFAEKLGDAHEKGRPGTEEDNRVDGINNERAIKYALDYPQLSPIDATNAMWNQGLLAGYAFSVAPQHTKDEL